MADLRSDGRTVGRSDGRSDGRSVGRSVGRSDLRPPTSLKDVLLVIILGISAVPKYRINYLPDFGCTCLPALPRPCPCPLCCLAASRPGQEATPA